MIASYLFTLFIERIKEICAMLDNEHRSQIRRFVNRQAYRGKIAFGDVDDASQEVFLRLLVAFQSGKFIDVLFNPSDTAARDYVRYWLFGTARNVVREFGRHERRNRELIMRLVRRGYLPGASEPLDSLGICAFVNDCPTREAELVRSLLYGLSITEIARQQKLNRSTIYRRLKTLRSLASRLLLGIAEPTRSDR